MNELTLDNRNSSLSLHLRGPGGLFELVNVAGPLILSSAGVTIKLFCDRLMLSKYSEDAIAASMPAGLTAFVFQIFFFGIIGYTNAIVAQYKGAGREDKAGPAVWQAVYIAFGGSLVLSLLSTQAEPLFKLIGHSSNVQIQEAVYFRTLAEFAVFSFLSSALSSFWGGLGYTWILMAVNMLTASLNVLLNYVLIYGEWGFPELGIIGAGYGTVFSEAAGLLVYLVLFLSRNNRTRYNTWPKRGFSKDLMKRLLYYGTPNGFHFLLDLGAFNFFVLLMGKLPSATTGANAMEASNIVFAVNSIAFMPMLGVGQAVGILVGQSVGASDIPRAKRTTKTACLFALGFTLLLAILFFVWPDPLLNLFRREGADTQIETLALAKTLLRYVAAWMMLDVVWVIHMSAIKSAGDTHATTIAGIVLAWFGLAVPSYIALKLDATIGTLWTILVVYVWVGAMFFYLRYRNGKWETMKVIDEPPPPDLRTTPEIAATGLPFQE